MSIRWSELSSTERTVLEERFYVAAKVDAVLSEADAARDRAIEDRPVSLSLLQRYATSGDITLSTTQWNAVSQNPRLSEALDRFLRGASVAYFPRLAAASSDEAFERTGDGYVLRLLPTKAREDQLYLIISFDAGYEASVATLTVRPKEGVPVRLALPQPRNQRIQVLLERDSDIVRELRNDAEIFLQ